VLKALGGGLAIGGLAGCSHSPAGRKATHASTTGSTTSGAVTVGLTYTPDIQFAPFYVAKTRNYYAHAGLQVKLRHHGASESEFGALADGTEDFINAGGDEMVKARASGIDVVDIATLYHRYPAALIVGKKSSIKTMADTKGATIGTPGPYGETYYALLALLRQAGLKKSDVHIKHIGFTQQAALAGHKVDAVMGFVNNDVVQLEANGFPVRTIRLKPGSAPLVGVGIGTLDSTMHNHPDQVRAFVHATLKGVGYLIDHPEKTVDLSAKFIPTLTGQKKKKTALATLQATIPLLKSDNPGRNDPDTFEKMSAFMQEAHLIKKRVPPKDAFTNKFVSGS
jgi:NitT/TauT family transport system substrate-binding protein